MREKESMFKLNGNKYTKTNFERDFIPIRWCQWSKLEYAYTRVAIGILFTLVDIRPLVIFVFIFIWNCQHFVWLQMHFKRNKRVSNANITYFGCNNNTNIWNYAVNCYECYGSFRIISSKQCFIKSTILYGTLGWLFLVWKANIDHLLNGKFYCLMTTGNNHWRYKVHFTARTLSWNSFGNGLMMFFDFDFDFVLDEPHEFGSNDRGQDQNQYAIVRQ